MKDLVHLAEEYSFLWPWQQKIMGGFSDGKLQGALAPAENGGKADLMLQSRAAYLGQGARRESVETRDRDLDGWMVV